MTNPTLGLGITAAGAAQVAALAKSVGDLTSNLAALAATAGGGGDLKNLSALSNQIAGMRREMGVAVQELKTTLQEGFEKAYAGAARSAREGGEKVTKELAAVNVSIRAKSLELGNSLSAGVSARGIGSADAVAQMVAELKKRPEAVKAANDAVIAEQLKFEAKQKELWLAHLQSERERMAAEQTMMNNSVLQFRRMQEAKAAAIVKSNVALATTRAEGTFSSVLPNSFGQLRNVPKDLEDTAGKAAKATTNLAGLTQALNDGHSAARGLASGFGAMWLTWGNIAPLLAGAAISHSFMQVISVGADLQHTFETIRLLSEESISSVSKLNSQMLELARTGPFGPKQIADAMKTLSLAGLDAVEVGTSIKDVLNFAVAGDTSIAQAADVMTSVGAAFKISADQFNYIGDVISKSAAVSKSSVESMGNAFKSASTVNSLYGVSLEDVGVNLALLANIGIQNTAAGTSLTNMYIDLAGRTPKATKALKELGVEALDPLTGKMRALGPLYNDLLAALSKQTPVTQLQYINSIFAQRSRKDVVALVDSMRQAAKEGGDGVVTEFDRISKEIANAAGFQATSAALMMLTPLNQMKSVAATMQASFGEAFTGIQPYILSVSAKLKDMFNSEGFQNGLQRLVVGVAKLTELFVENIGVITTLGAVYVGFKIFGVVASVFAHLAENVALYTIAAAEAAPKSTVLAGALEVESVAAGTATAKIAALTAVQEAQNLASAAGASRTVAVGGAVSGLLSVGSKLVPWLTAAWAAWELYTFWSGKSAEKNADLSGATFDATLKALKAETDRLHELNDAKREGITLDELRSRSAISVALVDAQAPVQAAQKRVSDLEAQAPSPDSVSSAGKLGFGKRLQKDYDQALASARARLEVEKQIAASKQQQLETQAAALKTEAQEIADRAKAAKPAAPSGTGTRDTDPKRNFLTPDNDFATIQKEMDQNLAATRKQYEVDRQLLDSQHAQKIISEGTYQAKVLELTDTYSGKVRDIQLNSDEAALTELMQRTELAKKTLDPKALAQSLSNLNNVYEAFVQKMKATSSEVGSESFLRQQKSVDEMRGSIVKLNLSDDEYWNKATIKVRKAAELAASEHELENLSATARASREADIKVMEDNQDHLDLLTRDYNTAKIGVADFLKQMGDPDSYSEEATQKYLGMTAEVDNLANRLVAAKQHVVDLQKIAEGTAVDAVHNKAVEQLRKDYEAASKSITSNLADAILSGGKKGGSELKDWLKNLFLNPIKIVLQAVLQPVGNLAASIAFPGAAQGGTASGGASSLLNGASLFGRGSGTLSSGIGNTIGGGNIGATAGFANGSMSAANASGSIAANGAAGDSLDTFLASNGSFGTAAGGTVAAGGAATDATMAAAAASDVGSGAAAAGTVDVAATGAAAGAGESALAAIPVYGWIALAAIAAYEMFGKGGETRSGGQYKDTTFIQGPSGGEINGQATRDSIGATEGGINAMLKSMGSDLTLSTLSSGLESSKNGKGFAYAGGQLSNGTIFGQGTDGLGYLNRRGSMNPDEAAKAFSEELKQATLQALQTANVPGQLGDYLRQLGDIDKLSGGALDAALAKITNALTQKQQLEDKLFDLTATDLQKLNKTRDAERLTIDASNQLLLSEVYAQEDVNTAHTNLIDAFNRESATLQSTIDAHHTYADELRKFRDGLLLGDQSPLNAVGKTSEAQSQFDTAVAGARTGTVDSSTLTAAGSAYLAAALASAHTKSEYDAVFAKVSADLTLTAANQDSQATLAQQQLDVEKGQLDSLGTLNATVLSFADAWAAYTGAQSSLAAAKANEAQAATQAAADAATRAAAPPPPPGPQLGPNMPTQGSPSWQMANANFIAGLSPYGPDDARSYQSNGMAIDFSTGQDNNGGFAVGTNYVPYDMVTKVHKGERITPATDNPYANPYTPDVPQVREIPQGDDGKGALIREVQNLRSDLARHEACLTAIAKRTFETSQYSKEFRDRGIQVIPATDGSAVKVEVVTP